MVFRPYPVIVCLLLGTACSTAPPAPQPADADLGALWVRHAAEYEALSRQVYQAATAALPGFVADAGWSALPGQADAAALPPAVILDVDETVVSNVDFQLTYEPPFANWKLDKWNRENRARAVPGVAEFVAAARELGVTVFFVTNRPCEPAQTEPGVCAQKQTTIEDIEEAGIDADADHVLLSHERGWNREKVTRREHVAKDYRVIMLVGDDLGDFVPCVREKLYAPCTEAATAASRERLVAAHADYWGNGWYVLPNPMHGSWTSHVP